VLRVLGRPGNACDGLTRRDLLRVGGLSLFTSITLPRVLAARETARSAAPRSKARSVILLNLFGGPSHLDMFDLKPEAPAEVRGEFKPIATSVPGLQICELLPETARRMHRATLIRTVSHGYNSHNPYGVLTGFTGGNDRENYYAKRSDHPGIGSLCLALGLGGKTVPPYVYMPAYAGYTQGLRRAGPYGGYLGSQYDPLFSVCDPKFERKGSFYDPVLPMGEPTLQALDALPGVTADRLDRRRSLLEQIDASMERIEAGPQLASMGSFQRQAFEILTSSKTRRAFDLSDESEAARDRYGRHLYGSSLLTARRLVEAGSTFVCVNWECAVETHGGHWDMHSNNFGMLRFNLPILDQIYAALVDDLDQRGLLDTTLVIVMGEMGRTPKVNGNAGRDHWPQCGFALFTGGGVKAGCIHGTTDKHAAYPETHPVSQADVVATIYHLLGIDYRLTVPDLINRPVPISHGGEPVWGVLA
jgi:hypothetical protein